MSCNLPNGFLIGVGSSAYQIEGGASQDGKGESCIDRYCKTNPGWNTDRSNGDIACDSYNKTEDDLKLLKELGVDFYRFSISWTRLAPNGDCKSKLNQAGIDHYRHFIQRLIQEGITPMVTMFHWDMPQQLQDLGGWANSAVINYFEEYARLLFNEYGNMVKHWYVLNEPQLIAEYGYGGGPPGVDCRFPPGVMAPGIGDYLALHNQLIAHGRVYKLYQDQFKASQKGLIGIAIQVFGAEPETDTEKDKRASRRSILFELESVLHPLVKGDYPPGLQEIIETNSKHEGRLISRLPKFSPAEISLIKGSFDFIGINHYTTFMVKDGQVGPFPSQSWDSGVIKSVNPNSKLPGVSWLPHEPEGIRTCLNYIRNEYGQLPLYISENGCDDPSGIHDIHRIQFIKDYMRQVIQAINDGCIVHGFTIWSFLDSFEWASGYTAKFGLYHVDFMDTNRKRQPKDSVELVKYILKTRTIPE